MTQPTQPTLASSGLDEALDRALANCTDAWRRRALQGIRSLAETGVPFEAWDLVHAAGVPEPDHPNRWGGLLAYAARKGLIEKVKAAPSQRPTVHGSLVYWWRGVATVTGVR